jgi:hypothetical protein
MALCFRDHRNSEQLSLGSLYDGWHSPLGSGIRFIIRRRGQRWEMATTANIATYQLLDRSKTEKLVLGGKIRCIEPKFVQLWSITL